MRCFGSYLVTNQVSRFTRSKNSISKVFLESFPKSRLRMCLSFKNSAVQCRKKTQHDESISRRENWSAAARILDPVLMVFLKGICNYFQKSSMLTNKTKFGACGWQKACIIVSVSAYRFFSPPTRIWCCIVIPLLSLNIFRAKKGSKRTLLKTSVNICVGNKKGR